MLETQAHVEIGGETYDIVDSTYIGGTELNANTFNTMQDNIENEFNKTMPITNFSGNANNYTETSIGACNLNQNIPQISTGTFYGTMVVIKYGTGYCSQLLTDINSGVIYTRVFINNTMWTAWKKIITE